MATRKVVLCDTNILLDIFDRDRAYHKDAVALLWYRADNPNEVDLAASITSFKDSYYVLTRLYKNEAEARDSIDAVMGNHVRPVDMLAAYGREALDSGEPDFEDALIAACAEHEGAYALITRDAKAFRRCKVPSLSVAAFLEQEGFSLDDVPL